MYCLFKRCVINVMYILKLLHDVMTNKLCNILITNSMSSSKLTLDGSIDNIGCNVFMKKTDDGKYEISDNGIITSTYDTNGLELLISSEISLGELKFNSLGVKWSTGECSNTVMVDDFIVKYLDDPSDSIKYKTYAPCNIHKSIYEFICTKLSTNGFRVITKKHAILGDYLRMCATITNSFGVKISYKGTSKLVTLYDTMQTMRSDIVGVAHLGLSIIPLKSKDGNTLNAHRIGFTLLSMKNCKQLD